LPADRERDMERFLALLLIGVALALLGQTAL
jgi:hypothetical protein